MAWTIAWGGTTWNLASHELPDTPLSMPLTLGGDGVRRRYDGTPAVQERWNRRSLELSWTGIDAALYGTLSALVTGSGSVVVTTSDAMVGTVTGYVDRNTLQKRSYGYSSYNIAFSLRLTT